MSERRASFFCRRRRRRRLVGGRRARPSLLCLVHARNDDARRGPLAGLLTGMRSGYLSRMRAASAWRRSVWWWWRFRVWERGEGKRERGEFSLCFSFRHASFFVACARPMDRPLRRGSEQAMPADSPRGCSSLNDLTIFPRARERGGERALIRRALLLFERAVEGKEGGGIVGGATQRERARKRAFVRKEPACG